MTFLFPFSTASMAAVFAFLLFLYSLLRILRSRHGSTVKNKVAPEVAGAWPIIGHLHLLGGSDALHRTLGKMADKNGPIFTVRMGVYRALILSNWEMVKDCFTNNDKVLSTRPKAVSVEYMCYNYAMFGFTPYGPHWREMRKIASQELLSNHRLAMLNPVRKSELKSSLKEIYDLWVENKSQSDKVPMEMREWFEGLTLNVILRIVVGKHPRDDQTASSEGSQWLKGVREFFELIGVFTIGDALPFLRFLDIGGHEKAMKKVAEKMDGVLQGWLKEHKLKHASGQAHSEQNFMEVMLSLADQAANQSPLYDSDTINKATCLALILGGSDTTTATLTWVLSYLLNHRDALKKVQDELDIHVGRERLVEESDIKNLVYLQAIIKETLRLRPPSQLIPPREFMEDCVVAGYHVPAGTRLFLNLYKIQRDPTVWPDPDEFRPERFLTTHKDFDVRGKNFELLPFGCGRRICPGISFALQVLHYTLASLLQGFDIATPSDTPVDMTDSVGFTNPKATPLDILLTPRLSAELYG